MRVNSYKKSKREKKKKLYSSTYVVTTKVSVYNILGIICDTVQHDFFNISSRKRDNHFYVFIRVTHKSSPLQCLLPQLFWDPKYWYGPEDRRSVPPFMFRFCDIKWVKVSLVSVQIGIFLFWSFVFAWTWIFALLVNLLNAILGIFFACHCEMFVSQRWTCLWC